MWAQADGPQRQDTERRCVALMEKHFIYLFHGSALKRQKRRSTQGGQTQAGRAQIKLQIIPTHCAEQNRVTEIPRDCLCTASKDAKKSDLMTILRVHSFDSV